ncbi:hypothetical protein KEM48_005439 [Puccinia striiformis f. sp. tritici PST-130]|nr:hypothetical protein KEM48_005439 [Puccinia striiformis f. sp. tritici PST-130]
MRDSHQSSYQYSSSRRYSNNVHYHPEGDRHHDSSQGHARPSDQIGSPGSAKRRSLLLASPPAPISQSSSGSHPLRIQPEDHRTIEPILDTMRTQEQIHHSQSHPFNSGEVDECDKYNPLVLHHTRRQSIIQPHALSSWNNGHSSPRISEDHRDGQGVHIAQHPLQRPKHPRTQLFPPAHRVPQAQSFHHFRQSSQGTEEGFSTVFPLILPKPASRRIRRAGEGRSQGGIHESRFSGTKEVVYSGFATDIAQHPFPAGPKPSRLFADQ